VTVETYKPNEVRIHVAAGHAGHLILADPWFPGWTCTVNGEAAPVLRADYLFRAVAVPAEECEVVFRFVPRSARLGMGVSAGAATLIGLILLGWRRAGYSSP
jgi:uncharacterized membrane protein YfhO